MICHGIIRRGGMKHKVIASSHASFAMLFDDLVRRLEQTKQVIVKARFSWDNDLHKGFQAKIWTKGEDEV